MPRILVLVFVLLVLGAASGFCGTDPMRGPWDAPSPVAKTAPGPAGPADAALVAYQKFLSPAVGHRCKMNPSCSEYARECFAKHGFVLGWIMTADRLMRCGRSETTISPKVWVEGTLKTQDPVRVNDFWWDTPGK